MKPYNIKIYKGKDSNFFPELCKHIGRKFAYLYCQNAALQLCGDILGLLSFFSG